jgi:hypothetical protein
MIMMIKFVISIVIICLLKYTRKTTNFSLFRLIKEEEEEFGSIFIFFKWKKLLIMIIDEESSNPIVLAMRCAYLG